VTKSFYLTTPIYYVNDAPHIGHAYTTVAGDVLTRWHRQKGESVWFLTGTDEHGQKVMRTAEANNAAPQAWVDKLVQEAWKPNWEHLNIANDDFIRTTEKRHTERVQKFLQSLKDSGHIYAGKYEGPYCVGCEEFKLPGDLIEIDGAKCCPIHSKPIELVNENNWFFKLSAFVLITKTILMPVNQKVPATKLCHSSKVEFQIFQFLAQHLIGVFLFRGIPIKLCMSGLMRCLTMQPQLA
jgi:methionyl-tRNA synthetase